MDNITFANPKLLFFLLIVAPVIAWYVWKNHESTASIQISTIKGFGKSSRTYKYYLRHILFVFRVMAIALLIIALARPQSSDDFQNITTEGIDIVFALDISSSMLAQDFHPDRLEASKNIATQFISGRPYDRMGLVVFSGESFTQCPLTTDHAVLINLFKDIKSGMIEDGTAIGDGLANAVNRLKDSFAPSKVIILLTDGVNNRGSIAPITAAEIAHTFGIRTYTIGVGTMGMAPYPIPTNFGISYQNMKVEIDEEVLKQIAGITGGTYFRATDNKKLKDIYGEIDKMEKAKIEVTQYSRKNEKFMFLASISALLMILEITLKLTLLRNIP